MEHGGYRVLLYHGMARADDIFSALHRHGSMSDALGLLMNAEREPPQQRP
jgi:hypothetical protein